MIIVSLLVSILLLVVVGCLVRQSAERKSRADAVYCLSKMHSLIGQVQKHRGMTASYLQGNKSAELTLQEVRRNIAQVKSDLTGHTVILNMERWIGFSDHWTRLERNSMSLSLASSFEQHTALIENLLYMLEDLADQTGLSKSDAQEYRQLEILWRELPQVVEYIGQARAVGMAVSTKGESNQIDKVKLGYLHEKISNFSALVFDRLGSNASRSIGRDSSLSGAKAICVKLVDTIKAEFIQSNKVSLSSDAYFSLASQTMDAMNKILKTELSALSSKQ